MNSASPIVLVSPGRSGTTLISAVFEEHPDCSSGGETIDLIFDLWNAADRSLSHLTPELSERALAPAEERIASFVRQGFEYLLPDDKPFWFQKPIGIPAAFSPFLFDTDSWDERAARYWQVMGKTFPGGRFFTVLRNPLDTVLSYKSRFDADERTLWATLGFLAHILQHPSSLVRHAVSYESLVGDSERTVRALASFTGLSYNPAMLKAFETQHTLSDVRESSRSDGFTWKKRWRELDPQYAEARFLDAIKGLFDRFGRELELPDGFGSRGSPGQLAQPDGGGALGHDELSEMRQYIGHLQSRLQNINSVWEERALRLENEYRQAYLSKEAEMAELTALRRHPAVRLLRKVGLITSSRRNGN